jgi:hypothetical protein
VITLRHHTAARLSIAGVSLVILLAAIAFSKRSTSMLEDEKKGLEETLPNPGPEPGTPDTVDDAAVGF